MPPKVKQVKRVTDRRAPYKWNTDRLLGMAEYVRTNYESYKAALGKQKKMTFLRKMKDELKLECTDQQLKNGFGNFLRKYSEIRTKLNASGFGIDPEKDSSLEEGWIMKICPYFKILDEVMGSRPNVAPPYIVSTSENIEVRVEMHDSDDDASNEQNEDPIGTNPNEGDDEPMDDNQESVVIPEASSTHFVKQALSGLQAEKEIRYASKNPLGVYSKIMGERVAETSKIEREKMDMQKIQFEADREIQNERNRIELLKVHSQIEVDKSRLELDSRLLADKEAERHHEIMKLKMQHEFELKKLVMLRNST